MPLTEVKTVAHDGLEISRKELARFRTRSWHRAVRLVNEVREAQTPLLKRILSEEYESEQATLDAYLAEEARRRAAKEVPA